MKPLTFICFSLLFAVTAQSQKNIFIRVYNENGKKVHKGFLTVVSDSSMTVTFQKKNVEIPVEEISTIKLRRSFGHTVLVSTLVVGIPLAILFATNAPIDWFVRTAGEGVLAGLAGGAEWGVIIAAFRKRPQFQVSKERDRWIYVKNDLKKYLPGSIE